MRRKGLMRDGSFVMHETEQSEIVPRVDGTALTRFSRGPTRRARAEATPFVPRLTSHCRFFVLLVSTAR